MLGCFLTDRCQQPFPACHQPAPVRARHFGTHLPQQCHFIHG